MYRRHLIGLVTALFLIAPLSQAQEYVEGVHYDVLSEAQPIETGEKIEVREIFWYKCPHCYNLEPYVQDWLKRIPDNAEFIAQPGILNEQWAQHGRMFYTLEVLGKVDELHVQLFDAIHKEHQRIDSKDQFVKWAGSKGLDEKLVADTYSSFAVNSKINFAEQMGFKYAITGVPAIIIDGKYKTSVSKTGGHRQLFEVIDFLIEEAQKNRAG